MPRLTTPSGSYHLPACAQVGDVSADRAPRRVPAVVAVPVPLLGPLCGTSWWEGAAVGKLTVPDPCPAAVRDDIVFEKALVAAWI